MTEPRPTQAKPGPEAISVEEVQKWIKVIMPMPWPWLAFIGSGMVLSMFELTRTDKGGVVVVFHLTAVTAAFAALLWLPAVLKLIAVTGGGLKTPAGEASTPGLISSVFRSLAPDAKREALPAMIAALETAEPTTPKGERPQVREIREDLESQLASLSPDTRLARQKLEDFAREYTKLRQQMPSGSERTFRMNRIVAEARGLAAGAKYEPAEIVRLLESQDEGNRIIALTVLRVKPNTESFDVVLNAISNPMSAFEQYQGLKGMQAMMPTLSPSQRQALENVLKDQRSGRLGSRINRQDMSRWEVSTQLLAALRKGNSSS